MKKLALLFFIFPFLCIGQAPIETRLFSPEELKQDLNFLFEKLEAIHPALYHYTPKNRIDEARAAMEKQLLEPMTRLEFARKAIPVVSMLQDGHTSLSFPTEELSGYLKKGGKLFPVNVLIRDDKIFVTSHPSTETTDLMLAEIVSINGLSAAEVLEKLRSYTSAELDFYRDIRIQRAFNRLLWYCFGWGEEFDLQFSHKGALVNKYLYGITDQELRKRGPQRKAKPYSFYIDNNIGVLDFRAMNAMEEFGGFLDSTFTVIKERNISTLVIDVRNNGGGNSRMGDMLFQYIADKPFKQIDRMEVKHSAEGTKTEQDKIGTITVVDDTPLKKPKKGGNRFTGKTYLLTSNLTFSSANMLAIAFKCFGVGTIVGEETGGVYVAFGDLVSIKLPNTQLPASCAHKKFTHPCADGTVHGVKPDVEIVPTLDDIQNGQDPAMKYIFEVVKQGK